jgi:hypothetical protein
MCTVHIILKGRFLGIFYSSAELTVFNLEISIRRLAPPDWRLEKEAADKALRHTSG